MGEASLHQGAGKVETISAFTLSRTLCELFRETFRELFRETFREIFRETAEAAAGDHPGYV